ncbi:MAG: S8 family serine peptidase [Oligoflexia bacterium]|nr:S8 family serine peptidase [Oligoflexia bacterium]
MRSLLALLAATFTVGANASNVAIIDSGTDMLHKDIAPQAWINPLEIPRNQRDEDGNGYEDDVHGWNFAEQNHQVIDYKYLGRLTYDVRRFFDIQTAMMQGSATDEDIKWMRAKLQDQDFVKQLQVYGNFMHGTHVGGIAARQSADAKVMAVKIIPTEVQLPFFAQPKKEDKNGFGMFLLKQGLGLLAKQQMKMLEEVAVYVDNHKIDIANGSFGTGYPQAKMIVETLGRTIIKDITDEQIEEATMHFLNTLIKEGDHMVQSAENTLFVFAAGNDGLDNDKYPTSPTNIQADNVISVSATLKRGQLATFSNYGEKMVDVAAPGVGILSAVPGNQYLRVSGTSQAAPYVANIASKVKDANPELSPRQIKAIITKTVDKKDWLKGKVMSQGIVNKDRATRAAVLSRTMEVEKAIITANVDVADIATDNLSELKVRPTTLEGLVLPLPGQFVIK